MSDELNEKMIEAATNGKADEVNRLIDEGADPNAKNSGGLTALHRAVFYGHKDVVRVLLDRGANPNATQNDGWTPLVVLRFQLPEWKNTEKYNEGVLIREMLEMAGAKE